jgi:hypothetical protein
MDGFYAGTYVRKGDWKLIRFYARNDDGSDDLELYDLKNDLGERHNLAKEKPEIVNELNGLITDFLKDTDAVIPKLNPEAAKTVATPTDPLMTWKNRNCDATVKDGILTAKGTGPAPFLGVGANLTGPAKVTFRLRTATAGEGHVDLVPTAGAKTTEIVAFPYSVQGSEWQEITVDLPHKGPAPILRLYLPSATAPVEIDWVELKPAGAKARRWEF